jgi:hypothetical protein
MSTSDFVRRVRSACQSSCDRTGSKLLHPARLPPKLCNSTAASDVVAESPPVQQAGATFRSGGPRTPAQSERCTRGVNRCSTRSRLRRRAKGPPNEGGPARNAARDVKLWQTEGNGDNAARLIKRSTWRSARTHPCVAERLLVSRRADWVCCRSVTRCHTARHLAPGPRGLLIARFRAYL